MHIERLFRFSPGLKSLLYDMLRGLGGVSRPSVSWVASGTFEHNLLQILFKASIIEGRRALPNFYLVFSDS